jgi:hypothetical protein
MRAFLTGSRAYGIPRYDSDIDLVIRTEEMQKLSELGEVIESYEGESASIRFGKLNIIACATDRLFNLWFEGTEHLKSRKPVTRDEACTYFRELFSQL